MKYGNRLAGVLLLALTSPHLFAAPLIFTRESFSAHAAGLDLSTWILLGAGLLGLVIARKRAP